MRWAVLDANEMAAEWRGILSSVVSQWLAWEIDQHDTAQRVDDPSRADVVLLAHSGSMDFSRACRRELRRVGLSPDPAARDGSPLVVTGGAVDSTPRTALSIADVLAVGEAYQFIRTALSISSAQRLLAWADGYQHAITRRQFDSSRDADRPWLMPRQPAPLASPDPWVDWGVPDVRSNDGAVAIVAGKGCHMACTFCATTYRQTLRERPAADLIARIRHHTDHSDRPGRGVAVVSNDALHQPGWERVRGRLAHASLTVMELQDDANMLSLIRQRPRIARVGVEGMSPALRLAFGKPISDADLVERLARCHAGRVMTSTFWIHHAPFEQPDDWTLWWRLWDRLHAVIDWGMHRAKMTAFTPTPPAPLARFLPRQDDLPSRDDILERRTIETDRYGRLLISIGGQSAGWRQRAAEQYGISAADLPSGPGTVDMAPSVDDYRRMPHETISWPLSAERRWGAAETYRRRLTSPEWRRKASRRRMNVTASA